MMHKKDYTLIAEAIKEAKAIVKNHCRGEELGRTIWAVGVVKDEIARRLSDENPRFDWSKFENACSIEE